MIVRSQGWLLFRVGIHGEPGVLDCCSAWGYIELRV